MSVNKDAVRKVSAGIADGDVALVRRLLAECAELKDYSSIATISWLHIAAHYGSIDMIRMLLELGLSVNKIDDKGGNTPLMQTIGAGHIDAARFLLSHGADPNVDRTLIGAINRESEDLALEFVKLLVEYGADVNRVFPWFDSDDVTFTPLTWAVANEKTAIADYLRSKGAVAPEGPEAAGKRAPKNLSEYVVAYFEEHFGPVRPGALIEIVPVEPPIAVHCVPAGEGRSHITLFTTGMSEQAMKVPQGSEDYRHAELFIQLPAGWPLTKKALADPKHGWPIRWLRQIAKYPHQNGTWLGGPATLIANDDPPQPLGPGLPFTSWLLIAEHDFVSSDGRKIQLFRMLPLYTEERNLEIQKGIAALLRALDRNSVPFIVDLKRKSVANV